MLQPGHVHCVDVYIYVGGYEFYPPGYQRKKIFSTQYFFQTTNNNNSQSPTLSHLVSLRAPNVLYRGHICIDGTQEVSCMVPAIRPLVQVPTGGPEIE